MTETRTYPLRLPRSLKDAVENQFVATAIAEKVSALQTARFFADRKARADFKAFDKIMKRRRGKDEMPAVVDSGASPSGLPPRFRVALLLPRGAS